jgi:tRNA-dihydrouridine synthase A
MMDWTDKHDRYFLRLIAPDILLYTEMITAQALMHGNRDRLLAFNPEEHPVALQLGGSDSRLLAQCARMGQEAGYDEINLNVGCPSPRVSSGRFGACLMLEPTVVAECVAAMKASVTLPVSVKCRIGVDEQDSEEALQHFVGLAQQAGCDKLIVHARKAWLKGLSPKQNREIPPLRYEVVYRLKRYYSALPIIINGGIKTLADIDQHLPHVDGVMIGREAYHNPYFLADIQSIYMKNNKILDRIAVAENLLPYISRQLGNGVKLPSMTRHILGLFQGQRGAAIWRRHLSQHAHKEGAGAEVIKQALALVMNLT